VGGRERKRERKSKREEKRVKARGEETRSDGRAGLGEGIRSVLREEDEEKTMKGVRGKCGVQWEERAE